MITVKVTVKAKIQKAKPLEIIMQKKISRRVANPTADFLRIIRRLYSQFLI